MLHLWHHQVGVYHTGLKTTASTHAVTPQLIITTAYQIANMVANQPPPPVFNRGTAVQPDLPRKARSLFQGDKSYLTSHLQFLTLRTENIPISFDSLDFIYLWSEAFEMSDFLLLRHKRAIFCCLHSDVELKRLSSLRNEI